MVGGHRLCNLKIQKDPLVQCSEDVSVLRVHPGMEQRSQ